MQFKSRLCLLAIAGISSTAMLTACGGGGGDGGTSTQTAAPTPVPMVDNFGNCIASLPKTPFANGQASSTATPFMRYSINQTDLVTNLPSQMVMTGTWDASATSITVNGQSNNVMRSVWNMYNVGVSTPNWTENDFDLVDSNNQEIRYFGWFNPNTGSGPMQGSFNLTTNFLMAQQNALVKGAQPTPYTNTVWNMKWTGQTLAQFTQNPSAAQVNTYSLTGTAAYIGQETISTSQGSVQACHITFTAQANQSGTYQINVSSTDDQWITAIGTVQRHYIEHDYDATGALTYGVNRLNTLTGYIKNGLSYGVVTNP